MLLQLVYELASGRALLAALGLLLACLLVVSLALRPAGRKTGLLVALVGLIIVALSAPPIGWWVYFMFWMAALGWLALEIVEHRVNDRARLAVRIALGVAITTVLVLELWSFPSPHLPPRTHDRLIILGDSVAAGIGGVGEKTWPRQIAERHAIEVVDASMAGARVADALSKQAPATQSETGLVLLEIGGNDLVSRTPVTAFEAQLDALMSAVSKPDRIVLMFELPTPPFHGTYALAQRRIARRHGVRLIPRRHFVHVIRHADATTDGIHLAPAGHARMADLLDRLLGGTFVPSPAPGFRKVEPAPPPE